MCWGKGHIERALKLLLKPLKANPGDFGQKIVTVSEMAINRCSTYPKARCQLAQRQIGDVFLDYGCFQQGLPEIAVMKAFWVCLACARNHGIWTLNLPRDAQMLSLLTWVHKGGRRFLSQLASYWISKVLVA